jgi:DNA mismatch endonuclease, patch repair protein
MARAARAKRRAGTTPRRSDPAAEAAEPAPLPAIEGTARAAESGGSAVASRSRYRIREGHLLEVDDATSTRMGRVRQKGTRPELLVRGVLSELGHRFRLANRDLPGSPDIANRSRRWAVFVHGCFWHRHGCSATTTPGRNRAFWEAKFARNVIRDQQSTERLRALGYTVIVVWECETKRGLDAVRARLVSALATSPTVGQAAPRSHPGAPRSR